MGENFLWLLPTFGGSKSSSTSLETPSVRIISKAQWTKFLYNRAFGGERIARDLRRRGRRKKCKPAVPTTDIALGVTASINSPNALASDYALT